MLYKRKRHSRNTVLIAEAVWCGKTLGYEWRDMGLVQILLKKLSMCSISMLALLS